MKIEEKILSNFTLEYPLEELCDLNSCLFFDIETTGFLSSSSSIYLIGCSYFQNGNWIIKQFFANSLEEEESIIKAFMELTKEFDMLITYNGNTFDIPFVSAKCEKYGIPNTLEGMRGLDIYKRVYTYKNLLKLPDCKLKTIELFMGLERDDEYSGGELIEVYKEYVENHDYDLLRLLLLHNSDDMKGMLCILPVLSYYDLFNTPLSATRVRTNFYNDINGINRKELIIDLCFSNALKNPISFMGKGCHFKAEGNKGTLIVPIYEEELKYFYANYKDYYYLPLEDTALHKAVASFVDKDYRQQAKASNCYTRKFALYLPMFSILREPFFKREYKSDEYFFELTDEIKTDRNLFSEYANHIINSIAFQK